MATFNAVRCCFLPRAWKQTLILRANRNAASSIGIFGVKSGYQPVVKVGLERVRQGTFWMLCRQRPQNHWGIIPGEGFVLVISTFILIGG